MAGGGRYVRVASPPSPHEQPAAGAGAGPRLAAGACTATTRGPPTREADVSRVLLDWQRLSGESGLVALQGGRRGRARRRAGREQAVRPGPQPGRQPARRAARAPPRALAATPRRVRCCMAATPPPRRRPTWMGVSSAGLPVLPSSARILMSAGTMSPRLQGGVGAGPAEARVRERRAGGGAGGGSAPSGSQRGRRRPRPQQLWPGAFVMTATSGSCP